MGNKKDPSWEGFFEYFSAGDIGRMSPADVASRFNRPLGNDADRSRAGSRTADAVVTSDQISEWRRRSSPRPPLSQLPELGYRWNRDPLFFARLIGAIPAEGLPDELALQRRILELRGELHSLEHHVRSADTTHATAAIVAEAIRGGKWAVAVHPAIEGPADFPIHVADRLDFRRTHGDTHSATRDDLDALWQDLGHVLGRGGVVHAPTMNTAWAPRADTKNLLRFSVSHTTTPFGPHRMWNHADLRGIAVVSLTLATWPMDVAAVVARILGFGFTSTRALSRNHRHSRTAVPTARDAASLRTHVHRELIASPWPRYVWGHVGAASADPASLFPDQPSDLRIYWLRESDELLHDLTRPHGAAAPRRLEDFREAHQGIAAAKLAATRSGVHIHEKHCPTAELGIDKRRTARWDRTFMLAAEIVSDLIDCGAVEERALDSCLANLALGDPIGIALRGWLDQSGHFSAWLGRSPV